MKVFRTSFRSTFLLALLLFISPISRNSHAGESTPVSDRDWKKYPTIVELPMPQVLYALGDVHGDCDRMLELLAGAKVIAAVPASPETIQWSAGNADLVVIGDFIDKYDQSLRVIAVLRALEPQIEKTGGHLVVCLGNHEAEFLATRGTGKKSAEFNKELTDAGISPGDVAAGHDKEGVGSWMRNLPCGAKIGDWFFCHAGNTGGRKLTDLEQDLEKELTTIGYATPLLLDPNSMLEARMHPRPWWEADANPGLHDLKESDHSTEPRNKPSNSRKSPEKLKEAVQALGAGHLVIGHQPGKATFSDGTVREAGQMFTHYDGLFFMIDTGMSRGVTGAAGALLRIATQSNHVIASAINSEGKSTLLWEN